MSRYAFSFALFLLLVALTRGNHATLGLAAFASAVFVLTANAAERASLSGDRGMTWKSASFLAAAAFGGLISAVVISWAYDRVVGPDPLRFGLAANIVMDAAVVAVVMGLLRALRWGHWKWQSRKR